MTTDKATSTGTDVVTVKAGAVKPAPRTAEVRAVTRDGEIELHTITVPAIYYDLPIVTDPAELIEQSMSRILEAATVVDLFADPDSVGLRDYSGRAVQIVSVDAVMPSTLRGGSVYVVGTLRDAPGAPLKSWSTGSPYAGGRAAQAQRLGLLPRWLRVVELESANSPGQSSLWLVDADQPQDGEAPF